VSEEVGPALAFLPPPAARFRFIYQLHLFCQTIRLVNVLRGVCLSRMVKSYKKIRHSGETTWPSCSTLPRSLRVSAVSRMKTGTWLERFRSYWIILSARLVATP